MRRVIVGAVVTAATALAGLGATAAAAQAATAKVPACKLSNVKVGLDRHGVASGHQGLTLTVKNTGRHTCTLTGYAMPWMENARHVVIPTSAHHGSTFAAHDPGAHKITLRPGATAYADLGWTDVQTPAAHPSYLAVSLPGSNAHISLRFNYGPVSHSLIDITAFAGHRLR